MSSVCMVHARACPPSAWDTRAHVLRLHVGGLGRACVFADRAGVVQVQKQAIICIRTSFVPLLFSTLKR
jgi:hypothetical protein